MLIEVKKPFLNLLDILNSFFTLDYFSDRNLFFLKIRFDATSFDKITKDRAAKFMDKLSAIGGTMGLLTGFSIISAVEIIYFASKLVYNFAAKQKNINKWLKWGWHL